MCGPVRRAVLEKRPQHGLSALLPFCLFPRQIKMTEPCMFSLIAADQMSIGTKVLSQDHIWVYFMSPSSAPGVVLVCLNRAASRDVGVFSAQPGMSWQTGQICHPGCSFSQCTPSPSPTLGCPSVGPSVLRNWTWQEGVGEAVVRLPALVPALHVVH